jgi:hypothetical protein
MAPLLPGAAYIYVLLLNPLGLAWEYLRRDPAYRAAWRRGRAVSPATWGVELLEDPDLDARTADPLWKSDPSGQVRLIADSTIKTGPPFSLWHLPGQRRLFHDGARLSLAGIAGAFGLRAILGDHVRDGVPRSYAVPPQSAVDALAAIANFERAIARSDSAAQAPSRRAVAHMRALQALDAAGAGMSEREIGAALFGSGAGKDWYSDSPLRASVRDALKRGRRYRDGHWRTLVWPV